VTDTTENSDVDVFEESGAKLQADADLDWIRLPRCDLLSVEEADELLR
jgi:hypothetical protein